VIPLTASLLGGLKVKLGTLLQIVRQTRGAKLRHVSQDGLRHTPPNALITTGVCDTHHVLPETAVEG
jgi:hypothetical protein